jgi:hypothetical protein
MRSIIKIQRQKTLKIPESPDLADEGSPARIVDSMWEAGNKKSSLLDRKYNILIT